MLIKKLYYRWEKKKRNGSSWNLTEVFLLLYLIFKGLEVTEEQLEEVAELSDVLSSNDDYLTADFRAKCELVIEDPLELDINDFPSAFRYLKENIDLNV